MRWVTDIPETIDHLPSNDRTPMFTFGEHLQMKERCETVTSVLEEKILAIKEMESSEPQALRQQYHWMDTLYTAFGKHMIIVEAIYKVDLAKFSYALPVYLKIVGRKNIIDKNHHVQDAARTYLAEILTHFGVQLDGRLLTHAEQISMLKMLINDQIGHMRSEQIVEIEKIVNDFSSAMTSAQSTLLTKIHAFEGAVRGHVAKATKLYTDIYNYCEVDEKFDVKAATLPETGSRFDAIQKTEREERFTHFDGRFASLTREISDESTLVKAASPIIREIINILDAVTKAQTGLGEKLIGWLDASAAKRAGARIVQGLAGR